MGSNRAAALALALCASVLVTPAPRAGLADEPGATSVAPAPDAAAIRASLRALADAGDADAVLRAADAALADDDRSEAGWEFRAFALHRLGRTSEARDAYRRLVALSPKHAWGWTQLGATEAELGRPAEARAALATAVALAPASKDAWTKLVRVLRDAEDWPAALRAVARAEAAGVDPAWCAVERASVAWASDDIETATRELHRATRIGADAAAVANLHRLVSFDATLTADERARRRTGALWRFSVPPVEVETRLAPRLPPSLDDALRTAAERFPAFVGVGPDVRTSFRLVLARTFEEHERSRRARFPGTAPGSAFTDRNADRRGPGLTTYAAWTQDGVERSVAHEFSHLLLGAWAPGAPEWLDEGVATYLEGWAVGEERGAVRADLLRTWRAARDAGRTIPWRDLVLPQTPGTFRGDGARLAYAQAWVLVHWIVHGEGGPGADGLRALIARTRAGGADPWTALVEAAKGDPSARLDAYAAALRGRG